jgi:hypothetical protein
VIEFTYLAYFLYDVSMEDLTIYNQIAALTNYFMRKTALNDSVKVVEKMWGRHAEVELPDSFAKRLENAKAEINIAETMVEFDNTYAGFINVPSASNMSTTDTALEDLRDTQKGQTSWRSQDEKKALIKLISHPREIYSFELGVTKQGESKEFFVYFTFTLGPVLINFWNIDEIAFLIYNKFDRENKSDIEKAVIKTLNSIWMIFGVKPDEKEKAKIIEKVHYELANTNLFG